MKNGDASEDRPSNDSELKTAKLKSRYQLLTTALGTTLVSLIGSYFVFVENTEKNLQNFDGGHREFVSKFVDIAIDDSIERRQRLARYFASVTLDDNQRDRWKDYADYIDKLIKDNPRLIAEAKEKLSTANAQEKLQLEARIKFFEQQLNPSEERANTQIKSSKQCNTQFESYPLRWQCIAMKELNLGVQEIEGEESNPRILDYAEYAASNSSFRQQGDNIPWAGLFVAWVIAQSGVDTKILPSNPYAGRNWLKFGKEIENPVPGVIAVFYVSDKSNRHSVRHSVVGFYDGEDKDGIYIIAGNINDSVKRHKLPHDRLIGYRGL